MDASARFAWAIESPAIEPEQSTTIFTLRGSGRARPPSFGWKEANTTCPAESRSASAYERAPPWASKVSTKSRSMTARSAASSMTAAPASRRPRTGWVAQFMRASRSNPSTRTVRPKRFSTMSAVSGAWCGARGLAP